MSFKDTMNEDLLVMLDVETFGVEVQLNPGPGSPGGSPLAEPISGIFDSEAFDVDAGPIQVSTTQPQVIVRTVDVPNVQQDQLIEVDGEPFTIKDIRHNGTGETVLKLFKA